MTTTSRLTRLVLPRWITSTRALEVAAGSEITDQSRPITVLIPHEGKFTVPLAADESTKQTATASGGSAQTANRLSEIIRDHVVKASRQMLASQSSTRKAVNEQSHSITPSQCYADAFSECHSSVSQYYGVSPQTNIAVECSGEATTSVTDTGDKNGSDSKAAVIASKRAKINEAKQNRISMSETQNRMKSLTANALAPAISVVSRMARLRDLCDYARDHPASRSVAVNQGIIQFLLALQSHNTKGKKRGLSDSKKLCGLINESLAVLGHSHPISTKGIRILSIDGGGTRGLVAIETLKQLEILCGAPIHTMFDYIGGVSTGGLLAVLVGPMKLSLDRCEAVYKECSQKIFDRGTLAGTANLLRKHCFYDMAVWEGILKEEIGAGRSMLSTTRDESSPRIGLLSTVMADVPHNYVFRNYNHSINSASQYPGTCNANVWEAIRASSAAPGYFEDFKLREHIHQDGGVLNNNPTSVAIHEAKALWPHEQVQCIVSVGNGRYEPTDSVQDVTSLRHKVGTFIHSATNTEGVHTVLNDLLPTDTYFRFNPYMSEEFLLNEIQEEKLQKMQFETQLYLRRNASKLNKAGQQLKLGRTPQRKVSDWIVDRCSRMSLGARL